MAPLAAQSLDHTRDKVMVFVQGHYGISHLAEYSFPLRIRLKDKPPGVGTYHDRLVKYRLTSQA